MKRQRNIKIIATLGPSTGNKQSIRELFEAGADAFRLNFSHGDCNEHLNNIKLIRELENSTGKHISIISDLQGPKIRIGKISKGFAVLKNGEQVRLDKNINLGNSKILPLHHQEIFPLVKKGHYILIDDGRVRLKVDKVGKNFIDSSIIIGGRITNNKGVNIPNLALPIKALTDKDIVNLKFSLKNEVDWIALSFVQRPKDVIEAHKLIAGRAGLMVKIEKPSALQKINKIIDLADAVMVARGDLGVELPIEDVPGIQKKLIRLARRMGKPVVVATQMLESMVNSPTPTRAEVSDVATAVYDGSDAVMLSEETSVGKFPIDAVSVMNRVAEKVEVDPLYRYIMDAEHPNPDPTTSDAITAAAGRVADTVSAKLIATYTTSGSTALRAARERPSVPILVLTPIKKTARRLTISWGLHCVETEDAHSMQDMVSRACDLARSEGLVKIGERIIITAGVPFGTPGTTNVFRIAKITKTGFYK